jgi:ABC-type antimicrobial peptide transport system permease subunit
MTDALYYPFWSLRVGQRNVVFTRQLDLVFESSLPTETVMEPVSAEIRGLDPRLPVTDVRSFDELTASAAARTRFTMTLLLVAACIATVLGGVGLYGVISYVVSRRVREIGLRMALGADPGNVARLVLRQALVLAAAGTAVGASCALVAGKVAVAQLYGVQPADPLTFAAAAAFLVAVAVAAAYPPARRASLLHPLDALRFE